MQRRVLRYIHYYEWPQNEDGHAYNASAKIGGTMIRVLFLREKYFVLQKCLKEYN